MFIKSFPKRGGGGSDTWEVFPNNPLFFTSSLILIFRAKRAPVLISALFAILPVIFLIFSFYRWRYIGGFLKLHPARPCATLLLLLSLGIVEED